MLLQLNIHKLIQDSQEYGSNNEHMVSRVFFDITANGKTIRNLHTNIKQTVGTSYENAPLEISAPQGYNGPFNFQLFQEIMEKYYRGLVGGAGRGIRISGGGNIRMQNNTFQMPQRAEFEVPDKIDAW